MIVPLVDQKIKTSEQFKEKYEILSNQCRNIRKLHQTKIKQEMTSVQEEYVHSIAFSLKVMNNRIYE